MAALRVLTQLTELRYWSSRLAQMPTNISTLLIIAIDMFEKNNFSGLSNAFFNAEVSFEVTFSI